MHTGTRKFVLGILIVVVAVALAAVVVLAFIMPRGSLAPSGVAASKSYTNSAYGYSFTYPTQYSVMEYSPESVSVGTPNEGGGVDAVANADLVMAAAGDEYASYNDFVEAVAMNSCAADGPAGSIRCTGVDHSLAYRSPSGVPGEEFYLTQVMTGEDGTSTSVRGPFYAFDITPNFTSAQFTALLLQVPATGDDTANGPVVSAIADSLRINAVPQPGSDATGQSCGGTAQSALVCPAGYHCAQGTAADQGGTCQPN